MKSVKKANAYVGDRGKSISSTDKEREEDLLEEIYTRWKSDRSPIPSEIAYHMDITRRELNFLLNKMVKHGYLEELEKGKELQLTVLGKQQGAECLARHQYLTQFLQLISGIDEQMAWENACRLERAVSEEIIHGICEFLKYGDTYDRIVRDFDLRGMYEEGTYEFCMSIYRAEQRYPRVLADEFDSFSDRLYLDVGSEGSSFFIFPKTEFFSRNLWYQDDGNWKKAEMEQGRFRIPAKIFTFTYSSSLPITEGGSIIAFTDNPEPPTEKDCRELNVHLW